MHPNDHVNASQSSNDVFPTAIHLAVAEALAVDLLPALSHLEDALRHKEREFADVVKSGRTHLMDATPVTLGQEFGGYATQVHQAAVRIEQALPHVGELPLGGTAVGTGINAPHGFAADVIARLAVRTGLPLREAPDHFAAQGREMRWSRRRATCARWRWRWSRSPTTCDGWAAGRGPGWPRSACPTCSRGARSCRARSTR